MGHIQSAQRAQTTRQTGGTYSGAHRGTGAMPTVHRDTADNQSESVPLGHCLLYIQRALITSQGGGGLEQRAQTARQSRGTDSVAQWGTINCRGHLQPAGGWGRLETDN